MRNSSFLIVTVSHLVRLCGGRQNPNPIPFVRRRHVVLPPEVAKLLPKNRLLSEVNAKNFSCIRLDRVLAFVLFV